MKFISNLLPDVFACFLVVTIWLRATTRYIVEADRILIRRAGFIWMTILFDDIENIEQIYLSFDNMFQIRMFQLNFSWRRPMLKIVKRTGFFRNIVIDPRDPAPVMEAFRR